MTFLNFTFQDSSPLISYSSGEWIQGSPSNDSFIERYSQASYKATTTPGATATLSFMGNGITLFGAKRPIHGNYSVILDDGVSEEFVGDENGFDMFQFPLWSAQNITNSLHTVVITNIPNSPNEDAFDLDFVSVSREIGPPGYTGPLFNMTIDDESPSIEYTGSWTPVFSETALNSTLHTASRKGDSASLSFQGSSIELYGLYNNAPFKVELDGGLPRNLAGPNVDLTGSAEHPQTLLFYADGLDENQTHTITITNSISNSRRPLQFDYAIAQSSLLASLFNDTFTGSKSINATVTPSMSTLKSMPMSTSNSPCNASNTSGSQRSHPAKVGAIVGGVFGGLAIVIIVFMGLVIRRFWRQLRYHESHMNSPQSEDSYSTISYSFRLLQHPVTEAKRFTLPSVSESRGVISLSSTSGSA